MPKSREELFQLLDDLAIATTTHEHPPLFTVEDSRAQRGEIAGLHSKNLFVRDRRKRYFLVVLEEDRAIDLKTLHLSIGAQGKVSFGSAEVLFDCLGVRPGSVSPFGVINDKAGAVTVVLERQLAEAPAVNFHPLENTRTTTISGDDLLRFLRATGHEPVILDPAGT
jgi:Ala-tRNA(Pro) deacylase